MTNEEIKQKVLEVYKDAEVLVDDPNQDGHKVGLYVKTSGFQGMTRIQQHQSIMAIFQTELQSGKMHAISLKTEIKSE